MARKGSSEIQKYLLSLSANPKIQQPAEAGKLHTKVVADFT